MQFVHVDPETLARWLGELPPEDDTLMDPTIESLIREYEEHGGEA